MMATTTNYRRQKMKLWTTFDACILRPDQEGRSLFSLTMKHYKDGRWYDWKVPKAWRCLARLVDMANEGHCDCFTSWSSSYFSVKFVVY